MTKKEQKKLTTKLETIRCMHCNRLIVKPALKGLTLICPHCNTPVNGQYIAANKTMFSKKN